LDKNRQNFQLLAILVDHHQYTVKNYSSPSSNSNDRSNNKKKRKRKDGDVGAIEPSRI